MDGVISLNEVLDIAKMSKRPCLLFKVGFEKAYESISWFFLEYILKTFGFDERWRSWIHVSVFFWKSLSIN